MAEELTTTPCGMNRRDFVKTTAAAYSVTPQLAAIPLLQQAPRMISRS